MKRHQTSTERDLAGLAARKERDAAAPEFVCEDVTGTYSSDPAKLREARGRRSTRQRLEHLEEKYDRLVHKAIDSRTKIIIAIVGAIGTIAGYLMAGCS